MASGSRHLSRIRGTAAGRSSKDTGQAARIRELTARSKIHPIWETTSRSSSGEAALIDQRIMAMQEATESKCAGLHDDNAMTMSWHCHGMRAWEAIDQVEATQKIQRKNR